MATLTWSVVFFSVLHVANSIYQPLVTGSSMIPALGPTLTLVKMNFLPTDGRRYNFDERAYGCSRGEDFDIVVIERLSDAI